MDNEIRYLYLDDIIPNRFQPRENFDEQALKELAVSIKEHGVIQPIIVRQFGDKYEIIAGERRYKASTLAGLTKIPAIVRNLDDKETSKVALLENLQRKDLTAIEEARTYQKILELDALTQEELAKTMGKSQSAVSNKLRLLSLTDEVQDALLNEQISERHARSLLNVTNPTRQVELLNKVITSRMTVRELEQEIKGVESKSSVLKEMNEPLFKNNNIDFQKNNFTRTIDEPVLPSINVTSNSSSNDEEILEDGILDGVINNKSTNDLNLNDGLYNSINLPKVPVNINDDIEELEQSDFSKPLFDSINSNDTNHNNSSSNTSESISKIKNCVTDLKNMGAKIDIEEFNFDDFYQIVLRIDK